MRSPSGTPRKCDWFRSTLHRIILRRLSPNLPVRLNRHPDMRAMESRMHGRNYDVLMLRPQDIKDVIDM